MSPRINIPPVTRILLIVIVLQSILSAAIRYRDWSSQAEVVIPYLTLIPQLSLIYPWTFITTTLVESNIFTLSISLFALYQCGRYLERAWSSRELGKFLLIVSLIPNMLVFGVMTLLFTFTKNERWTLTVISGTISLQISFLVAFSQLIPAHTVTLFRGVLSLRIPRFPILYIGVVTLLALTPLLTSASSFLALFGFLVSWTYLRFYKTIFPDLDTSQPTNLCGDASETFAFAEFFPDPVKPLVAQFANQIFNILVAMRLCAPFSAVEMPAARGEGGGVGMLSRGAPGSARAEAERRRALALKALDQRLHAATAGAASREGLHGKILAPLSASHSPAPAAYGPTVQAQPNPASHTAMTTKQPGGGLGELKYNPAGDDENSA